MLRGRVAVACLVAVLGWAMPAQAQDAHYWTEQFGNRALLLSGAVVADPADLSSVYYNPGGLALMAKPEVLLAGLDITFSDVTIADALGPGQDLTNSQTGFAPSLIAGMVPLPGKPTHRFAYSVLTRFAARLDGLAKRDLMGEDVTVPGATLESKALRFANQLGEHWVGGTYAYRMSDSFGVGASLFLAIRNQSAQSQNFAQLLNADNRALISDLSTGFDYRHFRLVPKIGVAGSFLRWDVGLTLTTPSVGLGGSGDTFNNTTLVGQALTEGGEPLTVIATNAQPDLAVDYRSPLSLAAGAARTFGPTTIHMSAEWFQAVDLYTVIDSQPFAAQSSGDLIDTAVRQELDSVVNFAAGVEQVVHDGLKVYGGFHTDFSAASPTTVSDLSLALWDLYHVSGGVTFAAFGQDFTLGANLALGSERTGVEEEASLGLITLPESSDISVQQITILLGFNFTFLE